MKELAGFSRWLRLAEYLLEPRDVIRIMGPAIADALFERPSHKDELGWLWRSRFQLACALCGAIASNAGERVRRARWLGFVSLLLAGLGGAAAIQQGPKPEIARNQLLFLFIAAIVSINIVVLPTRLLRSVGTATMLVGLFGLMACPWFGEQDQRQWLRFGALQIHVATLSLPGFVVFVRRAAASGRTRHLAIGTFSVLWLLLAQQNLEAVLVYSLTAGAALIEGQKWLSWVLALALFVASGIAVKATWNGPGWALLGVISLGLALGWGVTAGAGRGQRPLPTQSLTTAMVSLTLLRSLDADSLPVIGFGGSAIMAFFVLVALQVRESTAKSLPQGVDSSVLHRF